MADKLADDVPPPPRSPSWRRLEAVDPRGHGLRPSAGARWTPATASPCRCWPATTSPRTPARASSTPRPATAPTTTPSGWRTATARSPRRSIRTAPTTTHVPLFAGLKVLETEGKKAGKFGPANNAVIDKLIEAGDLLARGRLEHSYPHSWRSKAPVIFRNTPQWFIRMDEPLEDRHDGRTLRETRAGGHRRHRLLPGPGQEPHPRHGREPARLADQPPARLGLAAGHVRRQGHRPAAARRGGQRPHRRGRSPRRAPTPGSPGRPADFLGNARPRPTTRRSRTSSTSGSTPARPTPSSWRAARTPAGRRTSIWKAPTSIAAGSSPRCWRPAARAAARPTTAVLTHGFTLDENGREDVQVARQHRRAPGRSSRESGAEILRLWAAMVDYAEDQRIGKTILQTTVDAYRKLRNTVRYLLGALDGLRRGRARAARRHAAAGALHPAPAVGAGRPGARGLRGLSLPGRVAAARRLLHQTTCRRSTSTSARTSSIATGRTACAAAPAAR